MENLSLFLPPTGTTIQFPGFNPDTLVKCVRAHALPEVFQAKK